MKTLTAPKCSVLLWESLKEVENYFLGLDSKNPLAFDYETTGLAYDAIPLGLSLCQVTSDTSVFIPYNYFFTKGLESEGIATLCNKYFKGKKLIAHNAKYDSMIGLMNGFSDSSMEIYADTLVMVHLYDSSLDKNLEQRVFQDFKYRKQSFSEICGKKWNKIDWDKEGDSLLEMLAGYSGEDTFWTCRLYQKYSIMLDEQLWKIHDKIELPSIKILRDAKIRGVLMDIPLLKQMGRQLDSYLEKIESDIYSEAGCVFNLNSPKQKQEVFFQKMKLPIVTTTGKGSPSTDSGTFDTWAEQGIRVGELLSEYSTLNKLNSGYVRAIPELADNKNVLRGDINSCGTDTGRCSSSNPNLQNQPNSDQFPVRKAFIPRAGYVFINRDYSQLELRILAELSRDKNLLDVFKQGGDPHSDVAHRLGISRSAAKTVNFGVIYGLGPDNLARKLGISSKEASKIIDHDYVKAYPGVYSWKQRVQQYAKKHYYVRNYFGRIRRLPGVVSGSNYEYFSALRKAVNTTIQGTGADIVKLATVKTVESLRKNGLDAHFLLQVHDELLFEVREDQAILAEQIIINGMETAVKFSIPLLTDGKIILNWSEMKDSDIVSVPYRFSYVFSGLI